MSNRGIKKASTAYQPTGLLRILHLWEEGRQRDVSKKYITPFASLREPLYFKKIIAALASEHTSSVYM
jgi:hypothetical protein